MKENKEPKPNPEELHRSPSSWTWLIRSATGQWVLIVQTGPVDCAIGSLSILATGSHNDMLQAQKIIEKLAMRVISDAISCERGELRDGNG